MPNDTPGGGSSASVPSGELLSQQPEPTGASVRSPGGEDEAPPGRGSAGGHVPPSRPPPYLAPEPGPDAPRDRDGRAFDPTLHVHRAGAPVLNKDGTLRKRPINTDRRTSLPPEPDAPPRREGERSSAPGASQMPSSPEADAMYRTSAEVTVTTYVGIMSTIGEHWRAGSEEWQQQVEAWERYYRVRGIVDLPPEIMIAVALANYALGTEARRDDMRAVRDRAMTRFGLGGARARAHSGQDRVRQDHPGEAARH